MAAQRRAQRVGGDGTQVALVGAEHVGVVAVLVLEHAQGRARAAVGMLADHREGAPRDVIEDPVVRRVYMGIEA